MAKQQHVIVSLTSFPAAIPYAAGAIRSVLDGSVRPDKLVLYLTYSQFPEGKIPDEILELAQQDPIFEVRNYDDDIRSYRKLIPALLDFPESIIVTVDDDVRYHRHMLRDLLRLHREIPQAVLAHRAKRIKMNAPYKAWKKYRWYSFLTKRLYLDYGNIQTGVGGVLYPPHALNPEMLDPKLFKEIAPTTDDIWFWAAATAQGTLVVPVPFGHNKPKGLKKPKELSLKTTNFKSGVDLNRTAFEKILRQYPIIKQRLERK
ncbi:glycosyltransferase [Bacteroidales bacterium OttesenSCG-928-L03]|nr:glycosyltransferase [Bacteroidales bacterium OttesenSCG-928-L03]